MKIMEFKIIFGIAFGLCLLSSTAIFSFSQTEEYSDSTEIILSSSTISDNMIIDKPLSETIPVIKTLTNFTSDELSTNQDITLEEVVDGFVVSIIAKNTNTSPVTLDAESWYYKVITPLGETQQLISADNLVVPQNGSLEILRIDLGKYENLFESFPGIYTLELVGSSLQTKNFGEYSKFGKFENYRIKVNLQIDYDVDVIKQQTPYNGLLKTDGIQMAITHENNAELEKPYELNNNSPKRISFYLVNDGEERISTVVGSSMFYVWDAKNRYPAVGTELTSHFNEESCEFLDPGETILIDSFNFSKENWPISSIAIAKMEQNISDATLSNSEIDPSSLSGTYIMKYDYVTLPCEFDGQKITGSAHSLIASMEVLE